jgi:uncharacterized zinc-type alcohol dehydrogenase-like protein
MKVSSFAAHSPSSPLEPFDFETTETKSYECIIQVETCGICHSDIHMMKNNWNMTSYPIVPGHEVVGKVVEAGENAIVKIGDRVGVGWQSSSCLKCSDCLKGDENHCDHTVGTIVGRHGGFANFLQVDSRFCFLIPENLSSSHASPLLCAGITVYSALRYAGLNSGQNIGIIGIGGLGHLAVRFASKLGCKVTVFTTSPDKEKFALENGASEVVVTTKKKMTTKEKLDIILNTTHVDLNWSEYIRLLGADGVLSFVGVPPSNLNFHVGELLGKRKRVMASSIGGRAMMQEMLSLASRFGIEPIIEEFPKDKILEAIEKVETNQIRYRAVIKF